MNRNATEWNSPNGAMCSSRRHLVWLLVSMLILLVVVAIMTRGHHLDLLALGRKAERWKSERPNEAAVGAMALYVVWMVAFLPTTVPELVLGFIFGLAEGYAINVIGKLLGATICFVLGRTALRRCLLTLLGDNELLLAFEEEVQSKPYTTALLLRAAFVPFSLKNYGLALMGLPALSFFLALCLIDIPDSYICTAAGSAAKDLSELLSQRHVERADTRKAYSQLAVVALELVVLLVLLLHLHGLANRAIARRRAVGTVGTSCSTDSSASGTRPPSAARASAVPYDAERPALRILL